MRWHEFDPDNCESWPDLGEAVRVNLYYTPKTPYGETTARIQAVKCGNRLGAEWVSDKFGTFYIDSVNEWAEIDDDDEDDN